jgi:hypothetical protein
MLALNVAQLHSALREGDHALQTLSDSFTEMVISAQAIGEALEDAGIDQDSPIRSHDRAILEHVQQVVVAFQFYDKLSQRVSHVASALEWLSELTDAPQRAGQMKEWDCLRERILAVYSTLEERELFEALSAGVPVGSSRDEPTPSPGGEEGIEFF